MNSLNYNCTESPLNQTRRHHCWCGGDLSPVSFHPNYTRCLQCGTYATKHVPGLKDYQSLYSLKNYWMKRQKQKGHPDIQGRTEYDLNDGRVDCWLKVIDKYKEDQGLVIEVGCAHGVLLGRLQERGWQTIGVEVSEDVAEWTRKKFGLDIRSGIFPDVTLPRCDLFLAMDVLEHVIDPRAFVTKIYDILQDEGIAIIQTPMDEGKFNPPFGERQDAVFDDVEHLQIFTRASISRLFLDAGFRLISNFESWQNCHEILVAQKAEYVPSGSSHLSLANLKEMFSPPFIGFMKLLNAFAYRHGLRQYINWSKIWEYPWLWLNGLSRRNWCNTKLLDIGSEMGPLPWFIAGLGADVTLVERDPAYIKEWKRIRNETGLTVNWCITENERLPFPEKCFDVVTSLSVIEHQPDKQLAIDEAIRVMKIGGSLAVSFDICEPDMGMTFPEWNGKALTMKEFESIIWEHSALDKRNDKTEWNIKDCDDFIHWHLQSAPHHNYMVGAAILKRVV